MAATFLLSGFKDYYFENKILFRKSYKTKSISCKWQYRGKREIKQAEKNGIKGYWLTRNGKRKFYSLLSLKHRLVKCSPISQQSF